MQMRLWSYQSSQYTFFYTTKQHGFHLFPDGLVTIYSSINKSGSTLQSHCKSVVSKWGWGWGGSVGGWIHGGWGLGRFRITWITFLLLWYIYMYIYIIDNISRYKPHMIFLTMSLHRNTFPAWCKDDKSCINYQWCQDDKCCIYFKPGVKMTNSAYISSLVSRWQILHTFPAWCQDDKSCIHFQPGVNMTKPAYLSSLVSRWHTLHTFPAWCQDDKSCIHFLSGVKMTNPAYADVTLT